jgi:hypothetical protein
VKILEKNLLQYVSIHRNGNIFSSLKLKSGKADGWKLVSESLDALGTPVIEYRTLI